ncbi:MAG TPA: ABC transporter substrate-binding protein [Chloroflexota bacterium]|nr:ABC transporter substrate-binding protein [Chloroflexota bacterium]
MHRDGRSRWSLGLLVLLVALIVAACGAPAATPAPDGTASGRAAGAPGAASAPAPAASTSAPVPARVRVAYVTIASNILPMWLAQDAGIFEKYGLDVDLLYVAGAAKVSEALLGGDVEVGATVPASAIGPDLEGAELVMVAAWANKMAFSLFVQPAIQSVDQLRDKRLSVTRRGSASEIWAGGILERFGLEPERDYHFVAAGGQPEQLAALQAGGTDGAIIGPPTNVRARQMGLRELLSYQEYFLPMADVGLVTSRAYLREHPDVVERLLRAAAEAVALEFQQPERALAALAKWTETDDRELLEETLRFQDSRTDRTMIPAPEGMRAAVDELARNNPKAATANPADFFDLTLIQRLNDSGFIKSLYP